MRERRRATGNLPVRTGLPEWTAAAGEPNPPGRLRRRRRWTAAPPSRVPRRRLPSRLWKEKERTRIRSGPNEVGFRSGPERGRKGPGRGGGGAVRGAPGRGVEAAARRSGGGGVSTGVCGVSECACVRVGHLAGGGGRNFAECQITVLGNDTTALPSAVIWHSAKPLPLCRVPCWQHSAKPGFHFKILQFKIYLNIFL